MKLFFMMFTFSAVCVANPQRYACNPHLSDLDPPVRELLREMLVISEVPRLSGSETLIREHLVRYAQKRSLSYEVDEAGNLTVTKPGTGSFQNDQKYIAVQGHLDMVGVHRNEESADALNKIFSRGVPEIYRDGDWLSTRGNTSLGADNGVAIAHMKLLMNEQHPNRPPLKLIFTVEEETTFKGAKGLQLSNDIKALINLDMEGLSGLAIGCQGNCRWTAELKPKIELIQHLKLVNVSLWGLLGGHSGMEIHRGRGNAVRFLAQFVARSMDEIPSLRMAFIVAGQDGVFNIIPKTASARLFVSSGEVAQLVRLLIQMKATWQEELQRGLDPDTQIQLNLTYSNSSGSAVAVLDRASTLQALNTILNIPDGPILRDQNLPYGWNLTSNHSFLTAHADQGSFRFGIMTRSYDNESIERFTDNARKTALQMARDVSLSEIHASQPWTPNLQSPLIGIFKQVYDEFGLRYVEGAATVDRDQYTIGALPGGVEPAEFAGRYPQIPMIAFGPDIFFSTLSGGKTQSIELR